MSRAIDTLWIAKNDDQAIPARVKLRIFTAAGKRCEVCTLPIIGKLRPEYDHKLALINGGAHAEDNLQLLCSECHKVKTRADVAEKSTMARKQKKAAGIKKLSRGFYDKTKFKAKIGGGLVDRRTGLPASFNKGGTL